MDNLGKLKQTLSEMGKNSIPVSVVWANAKSIDWEQKEMTAIGTLDDLPYYHVLLGLGSKYVKPKEGTKCLLGIVQNNSAATFLIDCEEVEEYENTFSDKCTLKDDSFRLVIEGGKLLLENNEESLATLLSDTIDAILEVRHLTNVGPTINLTPDSITRFEALKTRFKNLLKNN